MSAPAGWYPDPQQPTPGMPLQQRYWDGQAWTPHVAPVDPDDPQPTYPVQPAGAGYQPYAAAPAYATRPTTPDGVPLAGWWHRVGASLIDFLILSGIVGLLALPFVRDVLSAFGDYFDAAMTAAENGTPTPSTTAFESEINGALLAIAAIGFVVSFGYTVAFLMWKQATPGKLAVGLRIRLRERPELPLSAVILRWGTQYGAPGLLGLVPFVSFLATLFSFLDVLWPLWDDKNQAIHDKVAKTNVVRIR
jgi:uncharacterized RDD family membrane protein YckC